MIIMNLMSLMIFQKKLVNMIKFIFISLIVIGTILFIGFFPYVTITIAVIISLLYFLPKKD